MSEEAQNPTQDSVIRLLADQARAIWKRRYLVLLIASACLALVLVWTLRQPKIYRATITIEFDPNPPRPLGRTVEDSDGVQNYWLSREYFSTQHQILSSQRVAEGVVRQLGLQHDAIFSRSKRNSVRVFAPGRPVMQQDCCEIISASSHSATVAWFSCTSKTQAPVAPS